jgi:uncharacterized protein (TIGR00369 family)
MAERMGIKLVSASATEVVGTMPVEGNTQPFGLLNGGASMALVETLGSIGAIFHAGPGRFAVGIEISGSHHKAVRSGIVTGTAKPISLGKTLAVYEVKINDESGDLICTGRITCLIREQKA